MENMLSAETNLALLQASQVKDPVAARNKERLDESAREFEAVFISEMMKPMFDGLETDNIFGGGKAEEIFRGMMIQEYGKNIASQDAIGIQTQVKNKLIELQAERTTRELDAWEIAKKENIVDIEFTER